jgi:ligand-binding sensor domain-containing protein/signal transduction histidine kinase
MTPEGFCKQSKGANLGRRKANVTPEATASIRTVILLLLLSFAAIDCHALGTTKPLKQYGRQSWQSDTGLPQNTVHAIAQTPDGFLWLATEGGLVRFDGQEFRTYDTSNTPELPGDFIESLAVDGRGTLWVSCAGGVVKLQGGRFIRFTVIPGQGARVVRVVKVLRSGGVLFATESGLSMSDGSGFRPVGGGVGQAGEALIAEAADGTVWVGSGREISPFSALTGTVGARLEMSDIGELRTVVAGAPGELWVGGREGMALFRGGVRVPMPSHDRGTKASVTAILPIAAGEAWIGTDAGLVRYAGGRTQATTAKGNTAGRVQRIFRDNAGAVWVAFDDGVTRALPGDSGRMQEPIDLPGVLSIFEDSEGDMWFGTDAGGVTVLREQAFTTTTVQDGLSDDFVRAVFEDHAGHIWVGTNRGGLNEIVDGRISAIRAGKAGAPASNVILALAESGGDLWVGTPDGLSRLHGGDWQLFTSANGLPDDFVRSLYADTDGSLWIGTRNGLSHYAHGRFTSYSRMDGLGSDLIGSILRVHDGTLWVGTLNGVSRFDGTGFRNFTQQDGLGGDAITTLAEDDAGTVWIAAHGAGLTRLRAGVFTAVPAAKSGLPTEIYSVLEDGASGRPKSLWMGTAKGVYRIALAQLNAIADGRNGVEAERFGVADGMKISECSGGGRPAGWRMQDGSLWFATLRGVAAIRPGSGFEDGRVPAASIEQVAIDDQTVLDAAAGMSGGELTVPAGRDRITIHYAAPSFQTPQKVAFRYMLEGFDRDWVTAGSRRTAYYTNVPAGSYRFLVAASTGKGGWSPVPGEWRFEVRPRFYRTLWFYLLLAILAGCLAYAVYSLRVRSVEASYQAVLAERNRIAREIHDTLAQGYVGISLQLELVARMLKRLRPAEGAPGAIETQIEAQVEATKEFVQVSLAEARSSIWKLRSSQSDAEAETLPARLAAAVRAKQEGSPAEIRLTVNGSFRPLERSIEDEMLRIGQEAISNSVRHASASAVDVVLQYETGYLQLKVSDDGKGFVPSAGAGSSGHYGLQGMRERAAGVGARLRIESSPGAGTSVEATLNISGAGDRGRRVERG